jgi:hypothetical protein
MRIGILAFIFICAHSVASQPGVAATFTGNTIEASVDGGSTSGGPLQSIVGPGVEFIDSQFGSGFLGPSFDFASDTITINWTNASPARLPLATYSFLDVFGTIDPIINVIIQSNSGAGGLLVSFDPNTIFFTHGSQAIAAGNSAVLAVTFDTAVVPVPPALPLFVSALTAMGIFRWWRQWRFVAA